MNTEPQSANMGIRIDALSRFRIVGVSTSSVTTPAFFSLASGAADSTSSYAYPMPHSQYYQIPKSVVIRSNIKSAWTNYFWRMVNDLLGPRQNNGKNLK